MNDHLAIRMFPANEGDCLLVEYGDAVRPRRILIDGGRSATYVRHLAPFLRGLPPDQRRLRLLVVTHVDRDHIEGALAMLRDRDRAVNFDAVWFNDYRNLLSDDPPRDDLGAVAGEDFTRRIKRLRWPRNPEFGGGAVSTGEDGVPVERTLDDGLVVTVLSPDRTRLERMVPRWQKECSRAGIEPGGTDEREENARAVLFAGDTDEPPVLAAAPTPVDRSPPNGTSIAFLLEYAGRRILFAGDAHPDLIMDALGKLGYGPDRPLPLDAFKVSHHGSSGNTTQDLMRCVSCPRYLISTDGSQFNHPDPEGIARIAVASGPPRTLYFNYRTSYTQLWDNEDWKSRYGYTTSFGDGAAVVVQL